MKMTANRGTPRRPNGSKQVPVRSVRVPEDIWEAAKRRATYEGVTMSTVMYEFVEGYAKGLVDLPKVTITYTPPRSTRTVA